MIFKSLERQEQQYFLHLKSRENAFNHKTFHSLYGTMALGIFDQCGALKWLRAKRLQQFVQIYSNDKVLF